MSGSIIKPCLEDNLNLVAKVFHRHISKADGYTKKDKNKILESKFDIDNFISKKYRSSLAVLTVNCGGAVYSQRRKLALCAVPTVKHIRKFLGLIFSKLQLNVQCAIVGLLYCERLMEQKKIAMTERNWRPILLVCLLESSKMWDDLASWNVEFSHLFPCLGIKEINRLEKMFLSEMGYDLFISGTMYAKYYFALRGLRYTNEHQIPRNYLEFKLGKKRVSLGLGLKGKQSAQEFEQIISRRSLRLGNIDEKSKNIEQKSPAHSKPSSYSSPSVPVDEKNATSPKTILRGPEQIQKVRSNMYRGGPQHFAITMPNVLDVDNMPKMPSISKVRSDPIFDKSCLPPPHTNHLLRIKSVNKVNK